MAESEKQNDKNNSNAKEQHPEHDEEEKKEEPNDKENHNKQKQKHKHHAHGKKGHHVHGKGCCHDHDHGEVDEMTFGTSLYQYIDRKNIKCLNESEPGAGKKIFKLYDDRLDASGFVESDVDGELLFTVYFTAEVQLRSIQVTS